MEQSSVTDSTAEGLSESIVTGNSVPSVQNSKAYSRRLHHPLTGTNLIINVYACMSVNLFCVASSKKLLELEYSLNFVLLLTFLKGEGNVVSYCLCVIISVVIAHVQYSNNEF